MIKYYEGQPVGYRQFWHGASRSEARIPPGPFLGGAPMKEFWDSLGIYERMFFAACW